MDTRIILSIIVYLAIGCVIDGPIVNRVMAKTDHSIICYIGILLIWPIILVGYICWFLVFLMMLVVSSLLLFGQLLKEVFHNE